MNNQGNNIQPTSGVNVSNFLPPSWTPNMVGVLNSWEQGCLVPGTLISWAENKGSKTVAGQQTPVDWETLQATEASGWSIIISQTCDIAAKGPGAKHPFILCCPLLDISNLDRGTIGNIEKWRVKYLTPVPGVPVGSKWATDLRVVVPISKDSLRHLTPIQGHPNTDDRRRFSEHVAEKFRRPALPDSLSEDLKTLIEGAIKEVGRSTTNIGDIEQIRLECLPDLSGISSVQIHVLTHNALPPKARQPFLECDTNIRLLLASEGIKYLGTSFHEVSKVSAIDYRRWIPLPVDGITRVQWR